MSKLIIASDSRSEKRQAEIRKVRGIPELIAILDEVSLEVRRNGKIADSLVASLSASKISEDEIKISHTGKGPVPTASKRIKTNTSPTEENLGVKLEKFVVPSRSELRSHTEVVQNLYDNARELDSIEALLSHSFTGAKNQPQALRAVQSLKAEVDKSIHTALSALNALANKHIPQEMRKINTKLIGFVLDTVDPKSYADITEQVYVSPKGQELYFSLYLCLSNLKDGHGFTYSEFYIVLTGVVHKGMIRYFLNTLPDFKVPGGYDIGKRVTNEKDAVQRIRLLLNVNDILSEADRRPMPVTTTDLANKGLTNLPFVTDVDVKNDAIRVWITPSTPSSKYNLLISRVLPALKAAIGLPAKSKSVFKWKSIHSGSKKGLEFILTPDIRSDDKDTLSLNLTRLNELQSALGLSAEELSKVKKALKSLL